MLLTMLTPKKQGAYFMQKGSEQMLEKEVEAKLVRGVKQLGGIAYKFVSPGNSGVPDRIVVLPGGRIEFVELKSKTGRLSSIQKRQIARLESAGKKVQVLYGEDDVAACLLSWGRVLLPEKLEAMERGEPL